MQPHLLQGVGRVKDSRAGTAGGRGWGLWAPRWSSSAWALHRQTLLVTEAQLGQELLVPIHGQLTHSREAENEPQREEGHEFISHKHQSVLAWESNTALETHHTVIGKDLDIVNRATQVLWDLPADISYRLVTVGLKTDETVRREPTTCLIPTVKNTSKVKVSLVDS